MKAISNHLIVKFVFNQINEIIFVFVVARELDHFFADVLFHQVLGWPPFAEKTLRYP